jgi:shikimate kinase
MQCAFYDTDYLVASLYRLKTGQCISVREIFKKEGEAYFRKLEKQTLLLLTHVRNSIIAVGGGLVLDPSNRQFLKQLGKLVYIKVKKKVTQERIFSSKRHGWPVFLDVHDPKESFEQLFKKRSEIYEQILAYELIVEDQKEDHEIFNELKTLWIKYGQ